MSPKDFRADYGIVVALEDELKAVLRVFGDFKRDVPTSSDTRYYHQTVVQCDDDSRRIVVAVRANSMGQQGAQSVTDDLIEAYNPRHILLLGIAGGIAERGAHFGDVLVPHVIHYVEPSKRTPDGIEERPKDYHPSPRLEEAARELKLDGALAGTPSWVKMILLERPNEIDELPQVLTDELATGEQVWGTLDDDDVRRALDRFPKVVGVETEAAGVFSAAHESPQRPDILVVKAFSDLVENKDDKYREYAAQSSAAFALRLIQFLGGRWDDDDRREPHAALNTRVPVPANQFVGRISEIEELTRLLSAVVNRLVTITGPGGIGKTRLALEVIQHVNTRFTGGVYFVQLADANDRRGAMSAIASAFGVEDIESLPAVLERASRQGPVLLVLDTVESVMTATADLHQLTQVADGIVVLATSQERLRLSNEIVYPLAPLSLPEREVPHVPEHVESYDSVRLLVARSKSVNPSFALDEENTETVVEICQRLDGLPLALELAAARMNMFSPAQLLERLEHRFAVLTRGPRDVPERQRTLLATLDWSYGLLTRSEQAILNCLSAFHGGFTVEAAEAVCRSNLNPGEAIPDIVSSLADKSLLSVDSDAHGRARLDMLTSVQEYATEKLQNSGDGDMTRAAHTDYFLSLAENAGPGLERARDATSSRQFANDYANVRAALHRSAESPDTVLRGLHAAVALRRFWLTGGRLDEGRSILRDLTSAAEMTPKDRVQALHAIATLASAQNDYREAVPCLEAALHIARELADENDIALCASDLGLAYQRTGQRANVMMLYQEALSIWTELRATNNVNVVLSNLTVFEMQQGEYEQAKERLERILREFRRSGALANTAAVLNTLGVLAMNTLQYEYAREGLQEALGIWESLHDEDGIASALENLGTISLATGELDDAQRQLERALALRISSGNYQGLEVTYKNLAVIAYSQHDLARTARRYAEFVDMSFRIGNETLLREAIYRLGTLAVIAGSWEVGLQLLAASGHSHGDVYLHVGFDQPAFQASYDAAEASVGYEILNEAYSAGLSMSLLDAAAVSAREYLKAST